MTEFHTLAGDVVLDDFDREPVDVAQLPAEVLGDLLHAAAIAAGALHAAADFLPYTRAQDGAAVEVKEAGVRLDHAVRAALDYVEIVLDGEDDDA